jgi:hypothetical protein
MATILIGHKKRKKVNFGYQIEFDNLTSMVRLGYGCGC